MNCPCAWIEPALTDAGIHRLLPDWDQRQRRLALAADLVALEVTPDPPRAGIIGADAGTILGWSYVLEGSRLGARLLLKTVEQGEDRDVFSATRFLRQGVGTDLWGSFKAVISEIDHDSDAIAKACAAAILAFECFKDALIRLEDARPSASPAERALFSQNHLEDGGSQIGRGFPIPSSICEFDSVARWYPSAIK
jgi:heme oxygenase